MPNNVCIACHYLMLAKILEALAKLQEGVSFAKVAETFSEDKARSGGLFGFHKR